MRPLYFAIIILIIIVIVVTMLFSFFRGGQEQLKKEQEPAKLPLSSEEIKKQEPPTLPITAIEEIKEKNIEELPALSLIQIANEPISGFKPLKDGLSRYIDKATGNIFYLIPTGDNRENGTVIRATYKNQSQREIYSSPFADFIVSFPKSDILSLATRPSGIAPGFLYQFNPLTGSFKKILGDIFGLEAKWDAKGEKFAFSGYDPDSQKPTLKFYNLKKEEVSALTFSGLAQKCAFSRIDADMVYCAVPKNPPLALYPDEWHQGLVKLEDEFFKINLKTGETKMIYNERLFDVWDIEVAPNEDFLYFKDRDNEFLWAIKLR